MIGKMSKKCLLKFFNDIPHSFMILELFQLIILSVISTMNLEFNE